MSPVVILAGLSWLVAQSLKYALGLLTNQRLPALATGGMPSGHSAFVAATATVIGLREGLDSSVFGLSVILAAVVILDAIRLRRAVGQQALSLNHLLLAAKLPPVVVWPGHRIREVGVGILLGVAVSTTLYIVWYG